MERFLSIQKVLFPSCTSQSALMFGTLLVVTLTGNHRQKDPSVLFCSLLFCFNKKRFMQTSNMRVSGQLSADCQGIIRRYIHCLFCGIVKKKEAHFLCTTFYSFFTQLLAFNTLVSFSLCLCLSPPEQLIIYQVGVLPSQFYNVLGDKDYAAFKSLLGKAMVLILLNSTVSSWIH